MSFQNMQGYSSVLPVYRVDKVKKEEDLIFDGENTDAADKHLGIKR